MHASMQTLAKSQGRSVCLSVRPSVCLIREPSQTAKFTDSLAARLLLLLLLLLLNRNKRRKLIAKTSQVRRADIATEKMIVFKW